MQGSSSSVRLSGQRDMPILFAAALLGFLSIGTRSAPAAECYPHCDYNHYYGPFDFTYIQPGLFGYPRCNPRGDCAPDLVYSTSGYSTSGIRRGRITVRFPRARTIR
jgi:hypothetical protein